MQFCRLIEYSNRYTPDEHGGRLVDPQVCHLLINMEIIICVKKLIFYPHVHVLNE